MLPWIKPELILTASSAWRASAGAYWANAVIATTFTINSTAAPGATAIINWSATLETP